MGMLSPSKHHRTPSGVKILLVAGAISGAAWMLARPVRVQVVGESMLPTLRPGDRALAVRPAWVRAGEIVVLVDPSSRGRTMVKRLIWQGRDGRGRRVVWAEGDNPAASTDSREFGLIGHGAVRGRLVWRYAPAERYGSVWRRPSSTARIRPG